MSRILFLMPSQTYRASAFLSAAQKLHLDVVVGSEKRQALEVFTPDKTITLNFHDPQESVASIVKFAQGHPLDAIIPVDETTAVIASMASKALSLPHNLPEAVIASREKQRMRSILAKSGLPSPGNRIFSIHDNPADLSSEVDYPAVLKPLFLSSGRGVIRVNNSIEFIAAFRRIVAILSDLEVASQDTDLSQKIMLEDFVAGDEVAVEGIFTRGQLKILAIFDKPDPLDGPFFEETIYVTPSRQPERTRNEMAKTILKASRAMGIRHGAVHAELRINREGIWLIEIAARSIGGLCAKTLRFDGDVSLEELILRHAIGENIDNLERETSAAGVMMIPIPKAGTLQAIYGLEEARTIQHVEEINITIPISQPVVPLPEGNKYLGFIFARAARPEDVEVALRKSHQVLDFRIEP
ncbi:MAG: ATP-grasp domain-containing protein [bacterium]